MDKRIVELDALADDNSLHEYVWRKAWRTWLREAALRGIESGAQEHDATKVGVMPDTRPVSPDAVRGDK